ncbi:MAG: T9SS type A sorting domain-containing protein [Flavobacteriales bacterium]
MKHSRLARTGPQPALAAILAIATGAQAFAQTAYPDHTIQNVSWNSGTHHFAVMPGITSPGAPAQPVSISGTADAEFVSGTHVHLKDGFHAGAFTGNGRFHARIDETLGQAADLVIIAPDPDSYLIDNVVHVPKWEKFEIGLRLPPEYQDAIDRFFENYYSNGTEQAATPAEVDAAHDLNPYADDSLQLVITLTSPSNVQHMKWGFFMREADWESDDAEAELKSVPDNPLNPYHTHFRFAPPEEGEWQFALSIQAPHTTTVSNIALAPLEFTGYSFVCDPALADNHGFLHVNVTNKRTLQFEDGTPFFGMGTNLADVRRASTFGWGYYLHDFTYMSQAMDQLHEVGGNFLRMFLMRHLFAPEWVNFGVYDAYHAAPPCSGGGGVEHDGNGQYQCWAFDRMLDHARTNNIHIQLCVDPYPPIGGYENFIWGSHPYVINYLEPERDQDGRYDLKKFFYKNGDPYYKNDGVFYYWKRKYKYMMARWGYSVNIAAIEPFNEVDQMLTYRDDGDHTDPSNTLCPENRLIWPKDIYLPLILNEWITDITEYVRGPVGEANKLFALSYTDAFKAQDPGAQFHFYPFTNENLDILDVHRYLWWGESELENSFVEGADYRDTYLSNGEKKPFNRGEAAHATPVDDDADPTTDDYLAWKIFTNYDVPFHNELWSSAFTGNMTTGLTWWWERVFWWPDALPTPPDDPNNTELAASNELNWPHTLNIGTGPNPDYVYNVFNRTTYHHFKPLSDMLNNADLQAYHFFEGEYDAYSKVDFDSGVECYYLKDGFNSMAIGWIHNTRAYWENAYYIKTGVQEFLSCTAPTANAMVLNDFLTYHDFYITWFPTRMNTTTCPIDQVVNTGASGSIELDLSTAALGDITSTFLDTLHADYAFVISTAPIEKILLLPLEPFVGIQAHLEFDIYPNPAHEEVLLRFSDDISKDIVLQDLMGRAIGKWSDMVGTALRLSLSQLASGLYYIRVSSGETCKTKKLVVQ